MGKLAKIMQMARANGVLGVFSFIKYRIIIDAIALLARLIRFDTRRDGARQCIQDFIAETNAMKQPRILELGSRDISRKSQFTSYGEYVGFDIYPGNYVDVVGDAHQLSSYFPEGHFDAVYCISVFEHLAMPWKVVIEINKVLKPGGRLLIATHPTFPPHAQPWDFWRFSRSAFSVLLNSKTGFEILKCVEGLPCVVLPLSEFETKVGHRVLAFLLVCTVARKIGDCHLGLNWDAKIESILDNAYPKEYSDKVSDAFYSYRKDKLLGGNANVKNI
ncbi:MAG: class I SAM-dependent methyltransferase [Fibrobacteria bacterium]